MKNKLIACVLAICMAVALILTNLSSVNVWAIVDKVDFQEDFETYEVQENLYQDSNAYSANSDSSKQMFNKLSKKFTPYVNSNPCEYAITDVNPISDTKSIVLHQGSLMNNYRDYSGIKFNQDITQAITTFKIRVDKLLENTKVGISVAFKDSKTVGNSFSEKAIASIINSGGNINLNCGGQHKTLGNTVNTIKIITNNQVEPTVDIYVNDSKVNVDGIKLECTILNNLVGFGIKLGNTTRKENTQIVVDDITQKVEYPDNYNQLVSVIDHQPRSGYLIHSNIDSILKSLPKTVKVKKVVDYENVPVVWDNHISGYDSAYGQVQTCTINGTVMLPAYITNPDNIPLTTSIQVVVDKPASDYTFRVNGYSQQPDMPLVEVDGVLYVSELFFNKYFNAQIEEHPYTHDIKVYLDGYMFRITNNMTICTLEHREGNFFHNDSSGLPFPIFFNKTSSLELDGTVKKIMNLNFFPIKSMLDAINASCKIDANNHEVHFVTKAQQVHTFGMEQATNIGILNRFYRAMQVQGAGVHAGIELRKIPEYLTTGSDFNYLKKDTDREIPFVDNISIVRFCGGHDVGWGEWKNTDVNGIFDDYQNARLGDLAYVEGGIEKVDSHGRRYLEGGTVKYRWNQMFESLDNYVNSGIDKIIIALDNVPFDLRAYESMGIYGQIAPPRDYDEWYEFIHEMLNQLIGYYGIDLVSSWSFKLGTEVQRANRVLNGGHAHTFDGNHTDFMNWYEATAQAFQEINQANNVYIRLAPGELSGGLATNIKDDSVDYTKITDQSINGVNSRTNGSLPYDFGACSSHTVPAFRPSDGRMIGAWFPLDRVASNIKASKELGEGFGDKDFYVFQYGVLTSDEVDSSGTALNPNSLGSETSWALQTALYMKKYIPNLQTINHWSPIIPLGITTGEDKFIYNDIGLYCLFLDHMAGGTGTLLESNLGSDGSTALGLLSQKQDNNYLLTSLLNMDSASRSPQKMVYKLPKSEVGNINQNSIGFLTVDKDHCVTTEIKQDLFNAGVLKDSYMGTAVCCSDVRSMAVSPSACGGIINQNAQKYINIQREYLKLRKFPGTVTDDGNGNWIIEFELLPNSVAMMKLNHFGGKFRAEQAPDQFSINYIEEKTNENIPTTVEYKIGENGVWTKGNNQPIQILPDTNYSFRTIGTGLNRPSSSTVIIARPRKVVELAFQKDGLTTLNKVRPDVEYRKEGDTEWTTGPNDYMKLQPNVKYVFRYKQTPTSFLGQEVEYKIFENQPNITPPNSSNTYT